MNSTDPKISYSLGQQEPDAEAMNLDSVKGALDELFLLAGKYRKSERFKELLEVVSSFKRYSMFNAMLVNTQMRGARYVLPAKQWIRDYGRMPKENAQPLVMLQPMGPVMFGFDVSQTNGRELPRSFANPFEVGGRLQGQDFERSILNAKRDGVIVHRKALGSALGGYVRNAGDPSHFVGVDRSAGEQRVVQVDGQDVPIVAEITLNDNFPYETNYATLTHELGHLYCGHVGTPNTRWWPDRQRLDRNTAEFEAESVSYLVCVRAGLETPAAAYLHGYLNANAEVPRISLEFVFKAAHRIESMRLKRLKTRVDQGRVD